MAQITFTLTIPAGKNLSESAVRAFARQYQNLTADPLSDTYVGPDGMSDEEWLKERTRIWLTEQINEGLAGVYREVNPLPLRDDKIVTLNRVTATK